MTFAWVELAVEDVLTWALLSHNYRYGQEFALSFEYTERDRMLTAFAAGTAYRHVHVTSGTVPHISEFIYNHPHEVTWKGGVPSN